MQDYKDFELSDLFDLLAQQTAHYMKMLSGGATKVAFDSCRQVIIDIQLEIQERRMQKGKSTAPKADIFFAKGSTSSNRSKG